MLFSPETASQHLEGNPCLNVHFERVITSGQVYKSQWDYYIGLLCNENQSHLQLCEPQKQFCINHKDEVVFP